MRLARRHLVLACALLAGGLLALPARAAADTATAGVPTGGTAAPGGGTAAPGGGTAAPGGGTTTPRSSSSAGLVLRAGPGVLINRTTRLRGTVPSRWRGRQVTIQLFSGGTWSTVARTIADRSGKYSARWRATRSGRFTLRASVGGSSGAGAAVSSGLTTVTVYPSAIATWYGPRSGRVEQTACGVRLTSTTLGVAHRTLPCGTQVELYYRGRAVIVPVIDRGPYANNASWDLTVGTADWLGFTDVGIDRIGAMVVRRAA